MIDPRKAIVRRGYDTTAEAFANARAVLGPEATWVLRLIEELPEESWVLDLGCGNGVPVTRALADAGHEVTGVDFSVEQVARAKLLVPEARFIVGDMTAVSLAEKHFHGCIAWDSIFHLPPEEQPEMFRRVHSWLQPRSPFVVTFGGEAGELQTEHLDSPMYYGAMAPDDALRELRAAGFSIIEHVVDDFSGAGHMVVWAQT